MTTCHGSTASSSLSPRLKILVTEVPARFTTPVTPWVVLFAAPVTPRAALFATPVALRAEAARTHSSLASNR